jgi:hypothetical protein
MWHRAALGSITIFMLACVALLHLLWEQVMRAWLPNMVFHLGDAHEDEELTAMLSSQPNVFLLIDADKLNEIFQYAPILQPGSMFMVHDFNTDVQFSEIRTILVKNNIHMLHEDIANNVRTHLRFFYVAGFGNLAAVYPPIIEGTANFLRPDYKRPES